MIRFGVVGTNWISNEFIKAVENLEDCEVTSIYSRKLETGKKFAEENKLQYYYTSYEEMLASEEVDAVYIGSPNALHFEQSLAAIQKKKHVICEKAITSNVKELKQLIEEAKKYEVVIVEALKSLSMPIFEPLKAEIENIGTIRKVFLNFCQYSSKYDKYKNGELPNIFNPKFSAGGLMDIGIYCIYPCVALFGIPKSIRSQVTMLESGVDGGGTIVFEYDGFEATLIYSKINDSYIPNEIMGEEGSLIIHRISSPERLEKVTKKDKIITNITPSMEQIPMYYEVKEFVETIKKGKIESYIYTHELMLQVMELLEKIRKDNGIIFPADIKN
ncbi:MAG: Gfo/Idh/MocA family protein [Cellulosilyticaceae bacterium]